jgi:replicative DNA helicase
MNAPMASQVAQVVHPTQTAPVPPQNLDAEESVLGSMMLSPGAIGAVSEILDASDFYRESHAKVYRAALALYARGEPVDAITLVDALEERGELDDAGGRARIGELAALVPATANAAHYAKIVRETATLRGLIRAGQEIARLGWEREGETIDLVDRAEQLIFELSQSRVASEFAHIEALLKESFERITALYEAGEEVTGVASGFRDIDRLTSGFQPGNLIILAARPSMGKSGLALCMAANVAVRKGLPVALFTLEMSKSEVTQRLMCSEAKVESQRLRTGKLAADDWPRLTAACDKLAKAPIYVDDTGSITMMEIRSKARRLKSKEPNLALLIVDYLQLMTSGSNPENRVQEVSQISRNLKVLARDLEVPVIALSQLSRAVEQRHDKRPILSDLRESGCLAGETRVYLPDEGVYRPIRELEGESGFNVLAVDQRSFVLEPRRVLRAFATGHKRVYRLTTRVGRTIRATGNHKFLAVDGWRRLDDMAPGMRVAVPNALPGPAQQTMSDDELAALGQELTDRYSLAGSTAPVPEAVFAQPPAGIALFLRHLWAQEALDGRSAEDVYSTSFASASPELIRDVQSLLLRVGVVASRRLASSAANGSRSQRLTVADGGNLERFLSLVGRHRTASGESERETADWAGVADGGGYRAPVPTATWESAAGAVSRRAAAAIPARQLDGRPNWIADSDVGESPASGDVYWDEIVSIQPDGVEEVFDLTVEGLHNFVAEDVIVHNSLEQDADLVFFIYRDEYYNDETDAQGIAEVHLAKHRNGPTGTEKLAWLNRYAKFADLAAGG